MDMMSVKVRKNRKEYTFWGIRSFTVNGKHVVLYIQQTDTIQSDARFINDCKVISAFSCNSMDYRYTNQEAIDLTY